ncbi:putative lipase [Wickerhamomyces ciferrii]|uniref:Lipase n=1 Tax=Wickerhamomyces ciferrii (strain ATCC 14091 / BCRC 22168 / CBS 111 / JCM 3599 / NBRC 0793 / NRRL Y-1031 F-60-10) TaxID=1206466 RepID=K0KJN7_WICCF|nr:putative lipase [Wickerhamomyces ciferrii]CCH41298.1 putative lipase [Wickerhamomyces ciferrii]
MSESDILYRSKRAVRVGQLERYIITYEPEEQDITKLSLKSLWLKVRNIESLPMRAAFLMGPYILYVDVRTEEYHHSKSTFVTADQPKFEPNLSPGQSFNAELSLHNIKKKYVWIVDVVSQILFNTSTDVGFELLIGRNLESLGLKFDKLGSFNNQLTVNRKDTLDLWNLPKPIPQKDVHLVILTHGLHGNVTADMYYIKEQLDKAAKECDENLIVRGFSGNTCKTEKGVKYLGSRLAEHIIKNLYNEKVTKISFIGHSLGGLVQTFAIAYIEINFPWFFANVQAVNFITLASPLLGIFTDNPAYVKAALSVGMVGKTGQDLGLQVTQGKDPLLKLLPTGPTHRILKKFHNRTLYANAINDGIVPLYTSALLYLDWKGLTKVANAQKSRRRSTGDSSTSEPSGKIPNEHQLRDHEALKEVDGEDDFITKATKSFVNPFQKAINLIAPNAQSQTAQDKSTKKDGKSKQDEDKKAMKNFPKTSMIESAAAVLLPPLPPPKYIIDPESRPNVIIHDRVYTEADIPPKIERRKTFIENLDPNKHFEELEEEIAREWHKDMSWRKVLVNLEPDAHNNILVRRRFANAYGWNVIDHLIENHFNFNELKSEPQEDDDTQLDREQRSVTPDESSEAKELENILDRDNIQRDNKEIDLTDVNAPPNTSQLLEKTDWVNSKNEESFFDVGPTGFISNVNEMFENFRNWNIGIGSIGVEDNSIIQDNIETKNGDDEEITEEEKIRGDDPVRDVYNRGIMDNFY